LEKSVPVTFQILPKRQLVLFTYTGRVTLEESLEVVAKAASHPDHRPWLRHLCDLSGVTAVERDFLKLLQMQARVVDKMANSSPDLLVVFYAPGPEGQEMARMAQKSWDGLSSVKVMIQESELAALELLGLPEASLGALYSLVT
jgi:hypothetical protein